MAAGDSFGAGGVARDVMISTYIPLRWGNGAWALGAVLLVAAATVGAADVPAPESARQQPGSIAEIRRLDGIPINRIAVATADHDSAEIRIDGLPDEPVWAGIAPYDNMLVAIPATGKPGRYATETRWLATERGLYVSAMLHQPKETLVTRRTVRDEMIDRDTFGITLDTSGEGKFAYWFIIALGDTLMDGKVLPERNYTRDWDGPWYGKAALCDVGWCAEAFFPWSMMNLPNDTGPRTVGFAVSRQVSHENARYQWPGHAYSSSQFVSALNQMTLTNVEPRKLLQVIPFAAETIDERHDTNQSRVGADITWKPAPIVELAATVLPDFGSVEVDDVVLNLTAQETFFPEKRVFFLEGSEVFETSIRANPGNQLRFTNNENYATTSRRVFLNTFVPPPISLMNTRRIGGTPTQVEFPVGVIADRGELGLPTELLGAAKATGNSGGFRYGTLSAFEDNVDLIGRDPAGNEVNVGADGRNFGAVRTLYETSGAARHSLGYLGTVVDGPVYRSVVHGVDGHFTNADGRWIGEGMLIATDVDGTTGQGAQFEAQYAPNSRYQHRVTLDWFDEEVNFNDLGFLARNDYMGAQYAFLYANSRTGKAVTDVRGTVIVNGKRNVSEGYLVDGGLFWRNSMVFPGRYTLRSGVGFLPGGYEDRDSRGNGAYKTEDRVWAELLLATDASRKFSLSYNLAAQQENLGDWSYLIGAGVTWRPTDSFSVDLDYKYKSRHGWIVYQGGRNFGRYDGPEMLPALKMNWFLAAGHQLNFTVQWAGVRADEDGFYTVPRGDGELTPATRTLPSHDFTVSLFTLQARYRWEIAPLTDFYLVYNRGNTLPNLGEAEFSDLLDDAFSHPIINSYVAKLRWRFSN